jgi:putative copper export protein
MSLLSRLFTTLGLTRLRPGGEITEVGGSPRRSAAIFVLLALVAGLVLSVAAGATLALLLLDRPPDDDSAEAGFARDMITHHAQAVKMAEAVLERTDRPEVRQPAEAIYDSQQAESKTMNEMLLSKVASSVKDEPPQEDHGPQAGHTSIDPQEAAVSIAHSATLGAIVFLFGLVTFVALVWLPTSRNVGATSRGTIGLFVPWIWALFGLLVVAGAVELSLYAIRASGEPFSFGLLEQVLFETRVGHVWLMRLGLGLLMAIAATWAAGQRRAAYWWGAVGIGCILLITLTQLSHAAAEGGFLPFLADWIHLIASLWMGGLLGFPLVLLGPLRAMPPKQREKLRLRAVRRFSRVATLAVMALIVTGVYAILLHVPSVEGFLGTAYGRALMVKLGLAVLLFAAGGVNLVLRGQGPFERVVRLELILAVLIFVATGFLTTLPPASVGSP